MGPCELGVGQAGPSTGTPQGHPGRVRATVSLDACTAGRSLRRACVLAPGAARSFPPPGGLSFSCWFLVGRHSTAAEGHPLRFLTLVRHLARTEQPFVCFSVSLCPEDLSLVVSTEEKEFQPLGKISPTLGACGTESAALDPRAWAACLPSAV